MLSLPRRPPPEPATRPLPLRPALGVLVPCRNERAVVERKLRNLAAARWPEAGPGRVHRLLVVDDGSDDGTAALAGTLLAELFADGPVRTQVLANDVRPGKAGAIAAGLAALGGTVDVVVLTDADVVLRQDSLAGLADSFAARADLGMACGSQEFVADLADDGSCRGRGGGEPVRAAGLYDRATALVRALESRSGRLFSVHGQLLAWRRDLSLLPTPGIAADDLDLMRQVRAARMRVEKLDCAHFLEVKTAPGPRRREQQLRRARAYVQVAPLLTVPRDAGWTARLQFAAYRTLPLAAPWLAPLAAVSLPWLAGRLAGPPATAATAALVLLAALSPPGLRLARLLAVIARARRTESRTPLADRWDMPRA